MTEDRRKLASELLQEAVYRSRARQASGLAVGAPASAAATSPADPAKSAKSPKSPNSIGQCGLGQETIVDLDLSPRGRELFDALWPTRPGDANATAPTELHRIERVLTEWVERQDALDRKRNHFLRDFRQKHGFDRKDYSSAQGTELDAGLERVNAEVRQGLDQAAEELLGE